MLFLKLGSHYAAVANLNLLCKLAWSDTHRNPPTSASQGDSIIGEPLPPLLSLALNLLSGAQLHKPIVIILAQEGIFV